MFVSRALSRSACCALTCLAVLSITGCDDNEDAGSALVGSWITQACEQATDDSGMPVDFWVRGIYEFTGQGEILFGPETYSDADCVAKEDTSNTLMAPATYQDRGPQMLQEGIPGGGLLITFNANNRSLLIDAFYTMYSGPLCFSDAFTFNPAGFGITQAGNDTIDFTRCLSRMNVKYRG